MLHIELGDPFLVPVPIQGQVDFILQALRTLIMKLKPCKNVHKFVNDVIILCICSA